MQVNMQMEGSNNGASEQGSNSDDGQIILALRKMMKKEIEVIVIRTIHQVVGPIVENLIRKVVNEEIQSAQEKFLTGGNRNHTDEIIVSRERNLELKFLDDEVSGPVLTGKEIKGKGGTPMTVALVDKITDRVVERGPGSSAKVEIVVLDSSCDDEHNTSLEHFNNMIIREGDKKKPHFAKYNYVYLKEGIGFLKNSKLGHDSNWMKSCKCRLGARIVGNFDGIKVQEAWTKSFMVLDSRSKLYENHYPPSLSDQVWRLENIGKDGAPCERLNKNNISTVKDFLFLHSVDPQRLQQIAAGAKGKAIVAKWKATVEHAQTCIIDDKKIYRYYPSSESKTGVTFDVIGGLKGLIQDSHYVPITNLSDADKARAHKLLRSAFENQKDISSFVDGNSLLQQFPYRSSDDNGCDLATSEFIDGCDPTEPGTSCQSITSIVKPLQHSNSFRHHGLLESVIMGKVNDPHVGVSYWAPGCSFTNLEPVSSQSMNTNYHFGSLESITMGQISDAHLGVPHQGPSCSFSGLEPGISSQSMNINYHFGSLESMTMGQLNDPHLGVLPSFSYSDLEPGNSSQSTNNIRHFGSLESITMGQLNNSHLEVLYDAPSCLRSDFEHFGDNENFPKTNDIPPTPEAESHSRRQSNVAGIHLIEVVDALLWMVRARKKFMALREIHVQKRHRIR